MNARATPSLRIARLVIENFRTFHGPTEIPLASGGVADEVAVFHGGNGTGKSNALAALDLFFRASAAWMALRPEVASDDIRMRWEIPESYSGLIFSPRDWPPGVLDPLVLQVQFAEAKTPFCVRLMPAGNECILRMDGVWGPGDQPAVSPQAHVEPQVLARYLNPIRNQLEAPLGFGSVSLFRLDARRRFHHLGTGGQSWPSAPSSPLSQELAGRLLDLATSLNPLDTERSQRHGSARSGPPRKGKGRRDGDSPSGLSGAAAPDVRRVRGGK